MTATPWPATSHPAATDAHPTPSPGSWSTSTPSGGASEARPRLAFHLGALVATPQAISAARDAEVQAVAMVLRHLGCDWGDVDDAAAAANDDALAAGGELRSAYRLSDTVLLVVLTDEDRELTLVDVETVVTD